MRFVPIRPAMARILGERSLAFLIVLECPVLGRGCPTLRHASLNFHASSLKIMREVEPKVIAGPILGIEAIWARRVNQE